MSQKTQVPATEAGRVQGDLRRLRLGQEVKGLSPEARRSARFHGRTSEKPRQTPEKSRKKPPDAAMGVEFFGLFYVVLLDLDVV